MISIEGMIFLQILWSFRISGQWIHQYITGFGSYVLCCHTGRAMTRDERMYPKPELFNPDRFMNQDKTKADLTDPKDFIFGFGRRQVIIHVAVSSSFT